jgi:predicted nucleotide-binding protein (sugar kinase/HSP70/actin superfamily)
MTQHYAPETQSEPSVLLSRNTNTALKDVMRSIKALEKVYDKENKVLKNMDSKGFMEIQNEKLVTAKHYQTVMTQMLARKDEIAKADPKVKQVLKNAYADFTERSRLNLEAIERMQRSTERLGNTIRSAAIRSAQTQRSFSYGENGALSNTTKNKAVSSGLSETV